MAMASTGIAEALHELDTVYRAMGRKPPRRINGDSSLRDIQLEIKKALLEDERNKAIKGFETGILFASSGLEVLNDRLGQPLELRGFVRTTAKNIQEKKYDDVLHILYSKYCMRKDSKEEEVDDGIFSLCKTLVFSAVMYHVSNVDMNNFL